MEWNRFNVVTDGQWGSCGKGMVTSALTAVFKPEVMSTTNMANAGHTAVNENGEKWVAKALPSGAIMGKWMERYKPTILVGASAAFHLEQMLKEIGDLDGGTKVEIHPRAGVITGDHKRAEGTSTKHVASTMQGCAEMLSDKILRKKGLRLAGDYEELKTWTNDFTDSLIRRWWDLGVTVLHEGSQGFSLDINHGSHYPQCTSRGTTATQNMADMGVCHQMVGDVYLVIRPFPIRVGNVYEDGVEVGNSGGAYEGQAEITWQEVAKRSGMPAEEAEKLLERELTTVTKRLRRVFEFSDVQVRKAARINGATKIALNFANYVDWECSGCRRWNDLPQRVMEFVQRIQNVTGVPVEMVGTGPKYGDVCWRPTA